MTHKFIGLLVAITSIGTGSLAAQRSSTVDGTLTLDKKNHSFKHVLAYETTIDNEEAIAVVLSAQAIAGEQLKAARKAEKETTTRNLNGHSCGWYSRKPGSSSTSAQRPAAP